MPSATMPTRLGLVFDRTCPDRDAWDRSLLRWRNLSLGAETTRPENYNEGIRKGLADAFRDLPGAETLTVHLAWFADGPGAGIAEREGLDVPATPFGDKGTCAAADLAELLADCGWAPGFDLWDPVEEALRIVAEPVLAGATAGSALLIVGNSPPNLPVEASSPFRRLLEHRGVESTVRRTNALFTNLIRDLGARGVPLAYLFLRHDRKGDLEGRDLNVFQHMQEEVRRCLAHYLPVVSAPADAAGIGRGLGEALALLAPPR